ncbi:hypothetical protein EBR66_08445 [bacterium]|nr:hypothetical protein [bacterium]
MSAGDIKLPRFALAFAQLGEKKCVSLMTIAKAAVHCSSGGKVSDTYVFCTLSPTIHGRFISVATSFDVSLIQI